MDRDRNMNLQQKIDLDIQLIMDNEFINEVYEKYGLSLSEIRDKLLEMEREHIQELREQIIEYGYTVNGEVDFVDGYRTMIQDVLALIGEKSN